MTFDLAIAATRLLASEGTEGAPMADRVARACERVTIHLARLVGMTGIHTLFHRSLQLSCGTYPWLVDEATTGPGDEPFESLRVRMMPQRPDAIVASFVLVLSTFVGLLGRLIGEDLVWRLLHEVWPAVFPDAARGAP